MGFMLNNQLTKHYFLYDKFGINPIFITLVINCK